MESGTRPLIERYVKPFYLKMMRFNALQHGRFLATEIGSVAAAAPAQDLMTLLRSGWRERVMGAWLAVATDDPGVHEEVLRALTTSHGSLDAPPLAASAVLSSGSRAVPALTAYHQADTAHGWGAAGVAEAAMDHLRRQSGAESLLPKPAPEEATAFDGLLEVARLIRARGLQP